MPERGEITNRSRARQQATFRSLRYGCVTPTDLDGYVEWSKNVQGRWQSNLMVFFELKYGDSAPFKDGQRRSFEALINGLETAGIPAYFIHAVHDVADCEQDVDASIAMVREYYHGGQWHIPKRPVDIKEAVTFWRKKHLHTAPE